MASTEDLFNPDSSTQETPAESAESSQGQDTSGAAAGAAPAPARKRARRATKKTSAPAPAAEGSESAMAGAAETEPTSTAPTETEPTETVTASAGGDAPAPRTAKKAAAKKTAKKAAAKKTTAKKTTAKKAAKAAPADASVDPDVDTEPTAEEAAAALLGAPAGADASLEPAHVDDTEVEDDEVELDADGQPTAATVPSFGVLFQAPDPVAARPTRRRAATKAAGPPQVAPVPSTDTADVADVPDTQAAAGAPSDAEDRAPAPRRRRGRGGRAAQADAAQPAEADDDTAVTVEQIGQDDRDDAGQHRDDESESGSEGGRRRRRRGGKGRGRGRGQGDSDAGSGTPDSEGHEDEASDDEGRDAEGFDDQAGDGDGTSSRRRRRRRRSGSSAEGDDPPGTVTRVRESRRDEPQSVKGSTRLEAKKQRRREGREAGRRRTIITEAEFLARRESVERVMVVREREGRTQIGVLEDNVLVEHYVSRETNASMAGNVYLGRVQNVLPSMEAAFVDIGKGRNAVLYAGEVNWDAAGLENNQPKRIENALKSGDTVLVQVTKDPIGHKGARLTSQISLPGRYLVYVPEGSMTGISRKLPDTERSRLKSILKEVVPDSAGVIVRTAAEGASEEELRADVERLTKTWEKIKAKADSKTKGKGSAPSLVHGEPDLTVRVIRDVFNEDFTSLVVAGDQAWAEVSEYLGDVAPDLAGRLSKWTSEEDLFTHYRVDEQIAKAMDRKVWLPSGGSLVIDRTEAMTVVDVNTGKFVGSGGNLEETVTKNNIEAAEEIVRQLRLRDIGGIIVIDFIDMVLESNRELVVRRLLECLGRDRTKHQVAEVTSLGLVQMTRKRVGSGLIEVFSENCEHCGGRGIIVHADPVEKSSGGGDGGRDGGGRESGRDGGGNGGGSGAGGQAARSGRGRRGRAGAAGTAPEPAPLQVHSGPTPAQIAAAAHAAALKSAEHHHDDLHDDLHDDDLHRDDLHHDLPDEFDAGQDAPVVEVHEDVEQQQPEQADAIAAPAAEDASAQEKHVEPTPEPERAPQPVVAAPKRRKRGRVVAPAGPPRAVAGEDDALVAAEAGAEQS